MRIWIIAGALLWAGSALAAEPIQGPARIIDGDTLSVSAVHIRLARVDAPEMRQTCTGHDGVTYLCGRIARAVMAEIIGGQPVTCQPQNRDRYGRTVAVCATEAVPDIGRELIARGFAVKYYDRVRNCRYCAAEQEARAAGRGMWSGRFDLPENFRRNQRHHMAAKG